MRIEGVRFVVRSCGYGVLEEVSCADRGCAVWEDEEGIGEVWKGL